MSDTLGYYNANAEAFVDSTLDVSMDDIYRVFLPHVADGGHILDAGCGSGRDALYFHGHGYRVTAFDASQAITALARDIPHQDSRIDLERKAGALLDKVAA